jgi:hypothetical protein
MTAKEQVLAEALRIRASDRADLAAALLASLERRRSSRAVSR